MNPRDRVERALRGGHGDRVPFTMYESKIPQCTLTGPNFKKIGMGLGIQL